MSVIRTDLNKCIGCRTCVEICPMDVFYFHEEAHKSVLAYPENCQSCGQCLVNCRGRALGMANDQFGFPLTAFRAASMAVQSRVDVTETGMLAEITGGKLP